MRSKFENACLEGKLNLAKTFKIPPKFNFNKIFRIVCENGSLDVAQHLFAVFPKMENLEYALISACKNGHLDVIKWLCEIKPDIDLSAKFYEGFRKACAGGHIHVAQYLWSLDRTIQVSAYNNYALKNSTKYVEIVKWLLDINPMLNKYLPFKYACENGHLDTVKYLWPQNTEYVMYYICKNGHLDVLKFIISADKTIQLEDNLIEVACINGHLDIAKFLFELGFQLDDIINNVCSNGHLDVAKWLWSIKKYNIPFIMACELGHLDMAKWFLTLIDDSDKLNKIYEAFITACESGQLDVAKWLFSFNIQLDVLNTVTKFNYIDNFNTIDKIFYITLQEGHLHVIQWIISIFPEFNIYADNDKILKYSCMTSSCSMVRWIVEQYYKSSSYIKFDKYHLYYSRIKDILIKYNLIDPLTLDKDDIKYYKETKNM